jgi:hypothetical protein
MVGSVYAIVNAKAPLLHSCVRCGEPIDDLVAAQRQAGRLWVTAYSVSGDLHFELHGDMCEECALWDARRARSRARFAERAERDDTRR